MPRKKPATPAAPPEVSPPAVEEAPVEGGDALDPQAAEKAFKVVRDRLLAMSGDGLASVSTDRVKAAVKAAAIGRFVKRKDVRAAFASLPKDRFDMKHIDDLETLALATWHLAVALQSASAGKSEAKLPVSLVDGAMKIKTRMVALGEYNFGDDEADGKELASIKLGSGYEDLANDLIRLAKVYNKRREEVKRDPKNYVATDEADAGRLAHEIMRQLGEQRNLDQKTLVDLFGRAWTLLLSAYEEVAVPGAWLFRREGGASLFPSLFTVGRSAPARAPKPKQDEGKKDEGKKDGKGGG